MVKLIFVVFALFVFVAVVSALSIDDVAKQISTLNTPLNGFDLDPRGMASLHLGKSEWARYPISIGIGYDRLTSKLRLPFMDLTYNSKKVFQTENHHYLIPDQILLTKTSANETKKQLTFEDFDAFLAYVSDAQIENGVASDSYLKYAKLLEYLGSGSQTLMLNTIAYPKATLTVNVKKSKVDPAILRIIKSLPLTYDQDAYFKFIEYWGTDLIISGTIGGFIEQISMFKTCMANGVNFASEAQMQMLKQLFEKAYANVQISAKYLAYTRTDALTIKGGDPTLFNMTNFDLRVQTFLDHPVYIEVQTVPITDFFPEGRVKLNMIKAIESYLLEKKSFVTDLQEKWKKILAQPQKIISVLTYDGGMSLDQPQQVYSLTNGQVARSEFCPRYLTKNIIFNSCMGMNGFNDRVCRETSINRVVVGKYLTQDCYKNQQPLSCTLSNSHVQAVFGNVAGPLVKHGCSIAMNVHAVSGFDNFHPLSGKAHICCKDADIVMTANVYYSMAAIQSVCRPF
jgi:hypothetical protein